MRLLENGLEKGYRAVRWDASGNIAELQRFSAGRTNVPFAINNFGVAVGYADVPDPSEPGRDASQAVRGDPVRHDRNASNIDAAT